MYFIWSLWSKLKVDSKQCSSKYLHSWRLRNSLMNNGWVKEKNQERNEIFLELNEI